VADFFTMMEKLQGMLDSSEIEVKTKTGVSYRGKIDNLRSTQPFSKPAVKIRNSEGKINKILYDDISEIVDHATGKRVKT